MGDDETGRRCASMENKIKLVSHSSYARALRISSSSRDRPTDRRGTRVGFDDDDDTAGRSLKVVLSFF